MFRKTLLFFAGFWFGHTLLLTALREFNKHELWLFASFSVLLSGFVGFAFGFSFDRPTSTVLVRSVFVAIAAWYLWSVLLTYGIALIGFPAIAIVGPSRSSPDGSSETASRQGLALFPRSFCLNTMSITTREAHPTDISAVAELFDLYRQFYEQPSDLPLAQRFIVDRLSNRDSVILVAESAASGLLGFSQLYPSFCSVEAKPIYVLYDLFVLPSARKAGVGRLLLLAAEAKATVEGKARMGLTTARTNRAAQSLYESLGWMRDEVFVAYTRRINRS